MDLERGDVFELEGGIYEVDTVDDRIIIAYVLDGALDRIPDNNFPDGWKLTAFSDLRYWKEHPPGADLL
jgi:hypothetical protein